MGGIAALLSVKAVKLGLKGISRFFAKRSVNLLESQKRHLRTLDNINTNHAKPHDFDGVRKELAGEITGYDHVREMQSSVAVLNRVIRSLSGSLKDPSHNAATRNLVQSKINETKNLRSMMKNALGQE